MKQYPLIGISIIAIVILILASLTNVVGYQSVQSSNKKTINEAVNQRELLFQTIIDITNNKEIQRIILKSQMSRGIFPTSEFPVLTKNHLRQIYFIDLILSKVIGKSRMQSMVQQYQLIYPEFQQELNNVIEKDAVLKDEITQLPNSECDCENEITTGLWKFPILCFILLIIAVFFINFSLVLSYIFGDGIGDIFFDFFVLIAIIAATIAYKINCSWLQPYTRR